MNDTVFSIYTSGIPEGTPSTGVQDIKTQDLTRQLYIRNCDQKMAGNLSSIYQTLISLLNLSKESFYYKDEIVNTFLEKMTGSITSTVHQHEEKLAHYVLGDSTPRRILTYILASKFKRSSVPAIVDEPLTAELVNAVLRQIVQQKYEQRVPSGDIQDEFIRLLSGEQQSLMEISYTKQQQKQKQKQKNKNQDSDTMAIFNKKNQLDLGIKTDNYFQYMLTPETDLPRILLGLPVPVPILSLTYVSDGRECAVNVYPTVQFLYSHHIKGAYITDEVRQAVRRFGLELDSTTFCADFLAAAERNQAAPPAGGDGGLAVGQMVLLHSMTHEEFNGQRGTIVLPLNANGYWGIKLLNSPTNKPSGVRPECIEVVDGKWLSPGAGGTVAPDSSDAVKHLQVNVRLNHICQSPQYTLAALQEGVYVIGMKDQFNIHDMGSHPLCAQVQYVADEMGFVMYDINPGPTPAAMKNVDSFGPYFVEQYILMEALTKHEVALNVLDYYVSHRSKLQASLSGYNEAQGKGFICWRFLMNEAVKAAAAQGECSDAALTHT